MCGHLIRIIPSSSNCWIFCQARGIRYACCFMGELLPVLIECSSNFVCPGRLLNVILYFSKSSLKSFCFSGSKSSPAASVLPTSTAAWISSFPPTEQASAQRNLCEMFTDLSEKSNYQDDFQEFMNTKMKKNEIFKFWGQICFPLSSSTQWELEIENGVHQVYGCIIQCF